jgi:YVTN family beta-propeller protein
VVDRIAVEDSPMKMALSDNYLLVANLGGNTISVIDAKTNKLVNEIKTINQGVVAVEVNEEKNKVYAATFESGEIEVYQLDSGVYLRTIELPESTVIQQGYPADRVIEDVVFRTGGVALDYNPNNKMLYVANHNANNVVVVGDNDVPIQTIPVPRHPIEIKADTITDKLIVVSLAGNAVTFISMDTHEILESVTTGTGPWGMDVDEIDHKVYVTHRGSYNLAVVDTITHKVIDNIPLAERSHAVTVDDERNILYVSLMFGGKIVKFDADAMQTITVLNTGYQPWDMIVNPSNQQVYASMSKAGEIFVMSPQAVAAEIPVTVETDDVATYGSIIAHATNMQVHNAIADEKTNSITMDVTVPIDGTLAVKIPRTILDSGDETTGKDTDFVIMVDNSPVEVFADHCECLGDITDDARQIKFSVPEGAKQVEIIGTYVVPEFGSVVVLVLVAGIIASIAGPCQRMQN